MKRGKQAKSARRSGDREEQGNTRGGKKKQRAASKARQKQRGKAKPSRLEQVSATLQAAAKKANKKKKKLKLVEDKFAMPESDYLLIGELKKKCFVAGAVAKKNDLLRAGLRLLDRLAIAELIGALNALESVAKK